MHLTKLYEDLNSLVALELFDYNTTIERLISDHSIEFTYLNNINPSQFKDETNEEQFKVLRIYDVFYRNGKPLISDADYEVLYGIYVQSKWNRKDTEPLMFEPSIDSWKKHEHKIPMGSLDKQSTIEEIEKWNAKPHIAKSNTVASEKLDGISLSVDYICGQFKCATTRGDGIKGDDITENAKHFDGMVKALQEPWDCTIRGEVVITKENLKKINEILVKNGKDPLKNSRNGVAGLASKFKDRNEEILSLLTFMAYNIEVFDTHDTGENVV